MPCHSHHDSIKNWDRCQRGQPQVKCVRTRTGQRSQFLPKCIICLVALSSVPADCFGSSSTGTWMNGMDTNSVAYREKWQLKSMEDNDETSSQNDRDELASDCGADFGAEDLQTSGATLDDLNWRVEKLRLEEANVRRFLKARPRFLPYEDCSKWVQAWGQRWVTEQDWESWIAMGEKRNSYIPSKPETYYTGTGDWISWDHFLGVQSEGSSVKESIE